MSEDVGYKQVLTRKDLFGIAVGMIIGAGVMTLTGIGIDRTGRSVFISYLIATFFALFFAVPSNLSSSIARFKGGNYTVWSMFVGEKWAGAWIIIYFLGEMGICMYAPVPLQSISRHCSPHLIPESSPWRFATLVFCCKLFWNQHYGKGGKFPDRCPGRSNPFIYRLRYASCGFCKLL